MDGNCIADATSLQSLVDLISKKAHGKSAGIVTYIENEGPNRVRTIVEVGIPV